MRRLPIHAFSIVLFVVTVCFFFGNIASAHSHHGHSHHGQIDHGAHTLVGGWLHPLTGLDHLLAVAIVGLLATRVSGGTRFRLPLLYCAGIALGGVMGYLTRLTPSGDVCYPLALLTLGGFLATRRFDSILPLVVLLAGAVQGLPHGAALVTSTGAIEYSIGMIAMTGILIAAGITAGWLIKQSPRPQAVLATTSTAMWLIGVWSLAHLH